MLSTTKINTGKVTGRRVLHFNSVDDVLADARQLVEADRQGKLRRLGNWTLGQNLNHVATWIKLSYDGVPMSMPWFVKMPMRLFAKKTFFQGPMRSGSKIPGVANGTFGAEPIELDEAVNRFETEFARLKNAPPAIPHLIFGPLSHEQWIKTHLRHSELHLSFMQPA